VINSENSKKETKAGVKDKIKEQDLSKKIIQKKASDKERFRLDELTKKIKDLDEQLLRSLAENENIRKRHEKEINDNLKYSTKNFAFSLLTVTDNFQRAIESIPKDKTEKDPIFKNLVVGIKAIEKELYDILEKNGIKKFDCINKKFDPNLHQAVSKIHSNLVDGIIVQELQKGFMIGDRLLRPSMVVVSMGPEKKK